VLAPVSPVALRATFFASVIVVKREEERQERVRRAFSAVVGRQDAVEAK
jgi:hypothetical protein